MKKVKLNDNYSNGREGFNVVNFDSEGNAVLSTSTGVKFLRAGKGKAITIKRTALDDFLNGEDELEDFQLLN